MAQIVTLPNLNRCNPRNARNYKGEKFLVHQLKLLFIRSPRAVEAGSQPIGELAELCVWTGRSADASRHYASLWVHANLYWVSGYGQADGGGYCKVSAACDAAFRSAGLEMTESFSGAGMDAAQRAMLALGVALGCCRKNLYVVRGA